MSLLDGFMAAERERARIEDLKLMLKPAELIGKKHCIKCGFCCNRRTCIPTPKELKKIAKFLHLTPKELINKYYAIDSKWLRSDYYVKPAGENIKDLTGKFIPAYRTFNEGKCIFLDKNNNCKIYPVRPKSARLLKCWEKEDEKKLDKEDKELYDSWKNNVLEKEFGIKVNEDEDYDD